MRSLTPLLNALADLTEAEEMPEAKATAFLLRQAAPALLFAVQPPSVLDALIRAAALLPDALPCARLLAEAQSHLPWQASPAAGRQPSALAAAKAVVTLLGPEGPFHSPDFRFGLFYQAPGIYYPLHAHEAAETYTILAGAAEWRAGDTRSQPGPGDAIHHPPQMPHAMRAGPQGFLALWRWSGDIGFDSYTMLPDTEGLQM
jgi:quercetin dioxygenase-like cupin family protein